MVWYIHYSRTHVRFRSVYGLTIGPLYTYYSSTDSMRPKLIGC